MKKGVGRAVRVLRLTLGLHDKNFFRLLLRVSLPIMLQQAISAALYMIDTVMIGSLGETELAAVGAANQMSFLLIVCLYGVYGGAGIFLAQYWGKRDLCNIHRVQGLCLMIALGIASLFLITAQTLGAQLLARFSEDARVAALGASYLSIASFGYVLQATTLTYATTLKACNCVRPAMITGSIGLLTNTALNYALIFGHWGFPALGVRGAAIATAIAAFVDMLLLLSWTYARRTQAAARPGALLAQRWSLVKAFTRVTLPVFCNECFWSLSVVLLSLLYSKMGTGVLAGMTMFNTVERLAFVIFIGIGNGALIMIGNRIGEGKPQLATRYARRFLFLGIGVGVVTGAAMLALGPALLSAFNVSESIRMSIGLVLCIFALSMPIHVSNYILIVGVLRSGGDTRAAMSIDLVGQWLIYLPLAWFLGLVLHLPIYWVYLASLPCELYKMIRGVLRLRSRAWVNDVTTGSVPKPLRTADEIGSI